MAGGAVRRAVAALGSRPAAAVVSQFVVAGSSLLLQLVVARSLGDAALGTFSLLLGTLIALNTLQSGWVGDGLTVLDRHDPAIRAALQRHLGLAVVVISAVAFAVSSAIDGLSPATCALFAGVTALWALEETGRRLLIARREFRSLVVNDLAYLLGVLLWLAGSAALGRSVTVDGVLMAMGAGAVIAVIVAAVQLPAEETARVVGSRPASRVVASFGVWRSLQVGLRPTALAVTRFAVAASASAAVLGRLEAARLVMAPVLTVLGGVGVYLLPTYTEARRSGRTLRPGVVVMMGLLAAVPVVWCLVVLVGRDPLVDLLTDGRFTVAGAAIAGWAVYAAAFGAGIPPAHAVTAAGRSRRAFALRAVDNGVGVAAAVVLAMAGAVSWVPVGLALGAAVGAVLLLRASRTVTSGLVAV